MTGLARLAHASHEARPRAAPSSGTQPSEPKTRQRERHTRRPGKAKPFRARSRARRAPFDRTRNGEALFEGAADDEPLDLVGALVDLGDLGVAHHALDWVLLDVS